MLYATQPAPRSPACGWGVPAAASWDLGGGRFYFPLQEKKIKRIFFLALQGSCLLIEGFNRDCLALQQFQGANCRCACFMGWDGMGYNGIQWGGMGWGQLWACLLNLPNLWV